MRIIITWLLLVGTLAVNTLSITMPINGITPAAVSALYPNYFVPDGRTFSIWSVIYTGLLLFAIYLTAGLLRWPTGDERRTRVMAILPWFWATCLLNASWLLAWHHLQLALSLGIMLTLLYCLLRIGGLLQKRPPTLGLPEAWIVDGPFFIYLGWISVATLANATALLVHYGYSGAPLHPEWWSIILLGLATLAATVASLKFVRPAYTLVIAWAAWGIYRGQHLQAPLVGKAAMVVAGFCLTLGLFTYWQKIKLHRGIRVTH
ncbi:MAG TPA: hypothetical protein PKD90_10705 [Phnomibacter sp.]|nr:hypothetical protein [Phnomibacter sp.]